MFLKLASILAVVLVCSLTSCQRQSYFRTSVSALPSPQTLKPLPRNAPTQLQRFVDGAVAQAGVTTGYDPSYVQIKYPGGDVPKETGVCSDVIVRAFRSVGIDLQKEIHEDMTSAWPEYPKKWGLSSPDANIDHRRVPNLRTYLERKGKSLPVTDNKNDYLPGDIVSWDLGGGVDHIGIVTNYWSESEERFYIVHNIGGGTRVENRLFEWKITGHYRFF
jgi:uncharacterized protein YijF (DUF1287 family)